jgi:hypothetical protein
VLVTILYIASLKVFSKEGWIQAQILAISTGLFLFLLIVIILWAGVYEIWILRTGLVFAFLFSCLIWIIPIVWPELANKFHIKNNKLSSPAVGHDAIMQTKKPIFWGKITTALSFFFYVTFGYWLVMFSINPTRFRENFLHELWIVPVALTIATVQYFRTK